MIDTTRKKDWLCVHENVQLGCLSLPLAALIEIIESGENFAACRKFAANNKMAA